MTLVELRELIRSTLPEHLYSKPGAVLASGVSTLAPGHAYVMGINPGGNPKETTVPIIDLLAPPDDTSSYTHDCWQPKCEGPPRCDHLDSAGTVKSSALVKHQKNMIALAKSLGGTPATLFSANAIFGRSTRFSTLKVETGHTKQEWWDACWPVHKKFLSIVRPKMIVTLGYGAASSAFGLVHAKAGSPPWRPFSDEGGRGGWIFKARLPLDDGDSFETSVIGVPHPSYYAPGPILSEMLREFAGGHLTS